MPVSYSPWLVSLSIGVAILVSYTSLGLASRVSQSLRSLGGLWLVIGAITMGTGIWSMHFIGMLAMSLPIGLRYDIGMTLASLGIAILTSGFAIRIASSAQLGLVRHLVCSVVMGMGIVAMHYTGMGAIRILPAISFDPLLVAASVGIALSASYAALALTFKLRSPGQPRARMARLGAAVLMGLAIAGMHYTGMAASHFLPGSICRGGFAIDNGWLAVAVGLISIGLLSTTLITLVFDSHLASRARAHAERLQIANARLTHQATHDALTDLPNRALFIEQLKQGITAYAEDRRPLAVMLVDLDRFKPINDSLGHGTGDAVLGEVAGRLQALANDAGAVARMGADEFLVLARVAGARDVIEFAERIVHSLAQPYRVGAIELHMAASVGVTTFPFDNSSADVLVSHADEAMYEAKHDGGNGYRIFVPGTTVYTLDRIQLENDLWHAIERHQLELHYQPQVNIRDGQIVGLEALARWRHPLRGWVSPSEFIPLAESSGLIQRIGQWILEEVCRQINSWRRAGFDNIRVAVNLSARQFRQPDLVSVVEQTMHRYGIQAHHLELEVTESVVMSNFERARDTLEQLNHAGLRIAVDDFGTGYSSLSYLKRLPIGYLKIDRSFVMDLGTNVQSDAIVKAIIALAHGLGMSAIAEGVETTAQLACLLEFGCDHYQGYLFSRPRSAEHIIELLRREPLPFTDGDAVRSLLESAG